MNNAIHPQSHGQSPTLPHPSTSPPLPSLHNLSISPYTSHALGSGGLAQGDYRFNGVFGPPVPGQQQQGWSSPPKRNSRIGIPQTWYDPSRDSPNPHSQPFEPAAYRKDISPPALSPPSSTNSGPTSASTNPYAYHQPHNPAYDPNHFGSMAPSPPPGPGGMNSMGNMGIVGMPSFGLPSPNSAQSLNGYSSGLAPYSTQSLASLHGQSRSPDWSRPSSNVYGQMPLDDDVIPTAIVIKNIPFAVAREQLLGVIESLGAPLPYAFNYHHDNGIFRGLAFANFRAPDEAASVVAALNGYDVQGRKLRVEYKKVLQPGEKDKIEREKALKRMRSIQFDNPSSSSLVSREMPPPLTIPHHSGHSNNSNHNPNNLTVNVGAPRSNTASTNGRLSADIPDQSPPHSASSATSDNLPSSLDLNDPIALDIYSRVLVFKEDRMRDDLAFSKNLTPTERRIVHLVAQKLGLSSSTKGAEGEVKYVVVTREAIPRTAANGASGGIGGVAGGRAQASASATSSSYLSPYATSSSTAELSPSLRIKKSMPDLRGFNGPVVARDPSRSLTPQRSSGNLRLDAQSREYVSMGAAGGRRAHHSQSQHFNQPNGPNGYNSQNGGGYGNSNGSFNSYFGSSLDNAPPVPALPASYAGYHGRGHSLSAASSSSVNPASSPDSSEISGLGPAAPLRNPRGPQGETRGFGANTTATANGSAGNAGSQVNGQRNGLRSGTMNPGAGVMGVRLSEEDESEELIESLRTRESLDL